MPIFIVYNMNDATIQGIYDNFDYAKQSAEDDQECGIYYDYYIEEYWLHITNK